MRRRRRDGGGETTSRRAARPADRSVDERGLKLSIREKRERPYLYTDKEWKKRNQNPNAGGGKSSGLGEFWKLELAKNPGLLTDLLIPTGVDAAEAWRLLGSSPMRALSSSDASDDDEVLSSMDMSKMPSLGDLTCCLLLCGDGVDDVGKNGDVAKVEARGAVRGPSSKRVCCQVPLADFSLVGVEGGDGTSSSSSSVRSSQMGNAPSPMDMECDKPGRAGMADAMGSERERLRAPLGSRARCLPPRGTGTDFEGGGVGVPEASGPVWRRRASLPEGWAASLGVAVFDIWDFGEPLDGA